MFSGPELVHDQPTVATSQLREVRSSRARSERSLHDLADDLHPPRAHDDNRDAVAALPTSLIREAQLIRTTAVETR